MQISLRFLGACSLEIDGRTAAPPSTQKARALLAYLAMHRDRATTREALIEIFWPDADPDRARGNLKTALWAIRRSLASVGDADEILTADRASIRWSAPARIDVELLDASPEDAGARAQAIAAYRGDFLDGDFSEWALAQRERIALQYETLVARELEATHDARLAEVLLQRDPYREQAHSALIEAAAKTGSSRAVSAAYDRYVAALAEVGAEPSVALRDLAVRFARTDAAPTAFKIPFVGRSAELAVVDSLLVGERSPRPALLIYGPPGIGKSALLDAIQQKALDRGRQILRVNGHSDDETYGPWRSAYATRCAGDIDDLAAIHGAQLPRVVAENLALACKKPTVLLVDDAQTFSRDTQNIARAVIEQFARCGHVVAVAMRSEARNDLRLSLHAQHVMEFALDRLEPADVEAAVRRASHGSLPILETLLKERTKGHPLFMVGLCRQLLSSGAITREGGAWRMRGTSWRATVPDDVRRLFEMRLHERGVDAFRTAGLIALEPELTPDDIGSVLEMNEPRVLDAIDDLLALGVLREGEDGSLVFSHDVMREVAISSTATVRRRSLHRKVAARLSLSISRAAATRLAHHLDKAGDVEEAAKAYLSLGRHQIMLGANGDASDSIGRAEQLALQLGTEADDLRLLAAILLEQARAQQLAGELEASVRVLDRCVDCANRIGDDDTLLDAAILRAQTYARADRFDESIAPALAALEIARRKSDTPRELLALEITGEAYRDLCEYDKALETMRVTFEQASAGGFVEIAARCADQILATLVRAGRLADAFNWAPRAMEAAAVSGTRALAHTRYQRAFLFYALERYDEALADCDDALTTLDGLRVRNSDAQTPDGRLAYLLHNGKAMIAAAREDWPMLTREAAWMRASPWFASSPLLRGLALSFEAELCLRAGPETTARAKELLRDAPRDIGEGHFEVLDAWVALRERADNAEELLMKAFDAAGKAAAHLPTEVHRTLVLLAHIASEAENEPAARRARKLAARSAGARRAAAGPAFARANPRML